MGTNQTRAAVRPLRRLALGGVFAAAWLLFVASSAFGLGPALSVSPHATPPGSSITVTGTDHPQPCDVDNLTDLRLVWDGNLVLSQPIEVKSDGSFTVVVVVPANASRGHHQLASHCTARPPNSSPFQAPLATSSVEVVAPPARPSESSSSPPPSETRVLPSKIARTAPSGDDYLVRSGPPVPPTAFAETATNHDTAATDTGSELEPTAVVSRSPFPISLNSPKESFGDPASLVKSAVAAGFMLLLLGFPAELFNSTLEANYEEISGWVRRPRSGINRLKAWTAGIPKNVMFVIFAAVGGVIYSFLDPSLGFDLKSAALVVGLIVSIAVVTLAVEIPIMLYARRMGAGGYLSAFPQALFLGIACVVFSRLLRFRPGYVYGITYGYKPTNCEPSDRRIGKATAFGCVVLLSISLAAWVVWAPVDQAASKAGASMGLLILDSVLAGIVIAGIQGLVFGLLPLRFCDGHKVAAWNRVAWTALYGISIWAFVQIVLTPQGGFLSSSGGSLLKVVGLFVTFGLFSVGFWAYFRFRSARPTVPSVSEDRPAEEPALQGALRVQMPSD